MVRVDIFIRFFGSFFDSELRFRFLATAATGGEIGSNYFKNTEAAILVCSDLPPSSTRSKPQIVSGILISSVLR
ncbi:MAG: hypothetical protein HY505_02705 [Candidatus Yanofskybacteria bacterium]|nr:hypothetical protein [Candidatus Yanofskybacteria bacterium]